MDLVFLHGPAASGKLTVARELGSRLNFGVFHNHLVVDALTSVFQFGSQPFVELREQFWLATFEQATTAGVSMIFTFTPEPTVTPGFAERAHAAIEAAGGHIHFTRLTVSEQEQERRLDVPSRHEFAKLTDVAALRRLRAAQGELGLPPADLTIDTETMTPSEAARQVIDAFGLRPTAATQRYPKA